MYKISLVFWSMGGIGILLSRFTDLYAKANFNNHLCNIQVASGNSNNKMLSGSLYAEFRDKWSK